MVDPVESAPKAEPVIFTIGHSTRSLDEFILLLRAYGIERLVDVRTIPRSRHNPQFNREDLSLSLRNHRISYQHMKILGGLRHARADSANTAWENPSFRGFADYMQTREFEKGLEELIALAADSRLAIMCAEAVPWRCHRSLIADALTVRGIKVFHIISTASASQHKLNPMARINQTQVTYPG